MGRFIALLLAFYIGTQLVLWVSQKFRRFKGERTVQPPDSNKRSPWQNGDVEDADYEEIEK